MKYAVRVDSVSGHKWLVSITGEMIDGKDAVRARSYLCPDDRCRVPVSGIMPTAIETEDGRKPPCPYFRATETSHWKDCRGDYWVTERDLKGARIEKTKTKAEGTPVRLRRRSPLGRPQPPVDREPGGHIPWVPSPSPFDVNTRIGEPSSTLLKRFVEAYEDPLIDNEVTPIRIRGCVADCYEDAFRQVSTGVRKVRGRPCFVYYGRYSYHTEYRTGILAVFDGRSFDGKALTVWMAGNLEPRSSFNLVSTRLRQAAKGHTARIYALGSFIDTHGRYSIEVDGANYIWVTFYDTSETFLTAEISGRRTESADYPLAGAKGLSVKGYE